MHLLRKPAALQIVGYADSAFYDKIKNGLLPPPVKLGARASAWIEEELEEINKARILGKNNEEIKKLVKKLLEKRKELQVAA